MDQITRCGWVNNEEFYQKYHDEEWGIPVKTDDKQFEFLVLETFQAGLSWLTILRKRDGFRKAFDDFDYHKIAEYDEDKIQSLLINPEIVRNQLKIRATVSNAKAFLQIQNEFGSFSAYIWSFVNHEPIIGNWKSIKEVPATTEISDKLSKDLKKRGFKFVGSTVVYAHMQATGMVNDHVVDCFCFKK